MCLYAVYNTYITQPYLQVWPNCKLSSSNGEMAGHDVFHKRYSSFSAVSSYLLLHHSLRLFCCVDFFLDDNILCYGKEFEICTTNEILSRRSLIWRRKKIVPILIYLSLLFFWYLMSENQRCIKTTQETYQLGSILLY